MLNFYFLKIIDTIASVVKVAWWSPRYTYSVYVPYLPIYDYVRDGGEQEKNTAST